MSSTFSVILTDVVIDRIEHSAQVVQAWPVVLGASQALFEGHSSQSQLVKLDRDGAYLVPKRDICPIKNHCLQ